MNRETVRALATMTSAFYRAHAASFSATREHGWPGWDLLVEKTDIASRQRLKLFDLACGNMRFERYLHERLPQCEAKVTAWDNCENLALSIPCACPRWIIAFRSTDIIEQLEGGLCDAPQRQDLCACFGFMHHIPSFELRSTALNALVRAAAPGGYIATSFWQFMNDPKLASKAHAARGSLASHHVDESLLEPGDHVLGWQNDTDYLRFCHHTSEEEIDDLLAGVKYDVEEVARFSADGKSGNLNRYLLLRKLE